MKENVPILVVDDLLQNIRVLEALIRDMQFDIVTALSGNEALRLSLKYDFALVILDIQMPGMNGFEVAHLIRRNPKTSHFPIIFITDGRENILSQIEVYETGAVDYLIRPFEPVILRSKVRVFWELYQQRKMLEKFYSNLEEIVEERTAELKKANETISRLAATDELTELSNRRSFNESLSSNLSAVRRHQFPLSMIMIDLDHFKVLNDTYGHGEGDQILKAFADLLREMIRAEDVAARWGGEEFAVILPHTACEAAAALAERIREAFEQCYGCTTPIALSASFGVAQLQEGDDAESFIRRTDDALYQAKREGRNRVVVAECTSDLND